MSHSFYLWGAYSVTFLLLAAEVALLVRRWRGARRQKFTDKPKG
jgi:heme exporter protein CcmD